MDFSEQSSKLKPNRLLKVFKVIIIVIVILLILLAGLAFYGWRYVTKELKPVAASEQVVRFTIPTGSNPTQISDILEENGLIRNSSMFWYYLKYTKEGIQFKAGTYEMKPGLKNKEIIDHLNKGDIVKVEVMRFTIPEGFNVEQIAAKLSTQKLVDKTAFIATTDSDRSYSCGWTADIPSDKAIKHRLEGYLYPDTYEMKKDSTTEDIIERMLCEWDNKLEQLPADWQTQLEKQGLSFHELLTLASLVEREVVVEEERAKVAGVIYNRLKDKMPLQIDATVQYLFDESKERLYEKDLLIESPYNTYLHTGLPPGPIASPSLASIKAALYPEVTKFLFYVTKKDGTSGHLFAETFAQHKKNIAKSNAKK
ncbi:endolytic transglycosylase MltG [Paenibacillus psychroresistens]|uniref:Endolytic murein transglycosylase n=1 Tax=Paenibacillus psychroresistens TaxID=1778678 RepID=A0A6B8RIT2_9BACL|nr:endolytic transglycosylase MltG [Paenibacillus psychroresistens]QGQ95482.1 endolytic transglycosylase MltG [Paenibacillus psychroresistens]